MSQSNRSGFETWISWCVWHWQSMSQSNRSGFETVFLADAVRALTKSQSNRSGFETGIPAGAARTAACLNPTVVVLKQLSAVKSDASDKGLNPTVVVLKLPRQAWCHTGSEVSIQP